MRYFPCSAPFCLFFAILATLCYDVFMKKIFSALFLGILVISTLVPSLVLAQDATQQPTSLLPTDTGTGLPDGISVDCIRFLKRPSLRGEVRDNKDINATSKTAKQVKDTEDFAVEGVREGDSDTVGTAKEGVARVIFLDKNGKKISQTFTINARETALSCGIKTGRIDMWLIPYYLVRVIDFALLLAGLLSVLFIIIGGYHFIIGSYTDDKEKGKKTIMYALGGLVLCLLAYTLVNLLLLFVTS